MAGGKAARAAFPVSFLCWAALAGLVLRVAFGLVYWTGQPLTRDEEEYLSLARSLAAGRGFVYDNVLRAGAFVPFGRAPGYPAFLALTGGGDALAAHVPASVKVAQSVVGAIGVVLVGVIAFRLAGDRAARAAAVVAALYPAARLDRGIRPQRGGVLARGPRHGLAVRPRARPVRPPGRRPARRPGGRCRHPDSPGTPAVPAARRPVPAPASPAGRAGGAGRGRAARRGPRGRSATTNATGEFVLVASDGGVTFWTGNHPLAIGEGDMAANPAIKLDNRRLRAAHPGLTEEQMEPIYYREALRLDSGPSARLARCSKRASSSISSSRSVRPTRCTRGGTAWRRWSRTAAPAAGGAGRRGARNGACARTPGLWLLGASAVLVCLVFFPQERFRIPVIDPALVVLAGAGLAGWRHHGDRP